MTRRPEHFSKHALRDLSSCQHVSYVVRVGETGQFEKLA